MAQLNVLLVSGFKIFPNFTGGHLHTGGIAKALARLGYRVRLYSFAGRIEHYRPGRPPYLEETIEPGLIEETHLGIGIGLLQAGMRRLGYPRAWQYAMMRCGWVPARLKQALREADLILSDLPWCPPIPGPWRAKPWFMISHNLEYELLEHGPPRERRHARWMQRVESVAPTVYRDIFTCAESDRAFFRAHAGAEKRLPMIRCGVDAEIYKVAAGTRERMRAELGVAPDERLIIFSGSRFGPNLEALARLKKFCAANTQWLAERRLRLLVAGSMEDGPGRIGAMQMTGRVPDMIPYFAAADAGLNPVARGSGSNVKLFEYLAARLTVISTAFGVRGSELLAERDYLNFDPDNAAGAFARFAASDAAHWRAYAEAAWQRHQRSCDITELVREAIAVIPEFRTP